MKASSSGRVRRLLRALVLNGGLLCLSFLFAASCGEIAVRLAAPQQLIQIRPDLWVPRDTLGYAHRPGVDVRVNTGEGEVQVLTDAAGFRVGRAGAPAGGEQILVLGDSYMEALQVEYEESFSGLLQQRLPAATGRAVAVRNAGIDGWSPNQYLLRARQLFEEQDFELVVTAIYLANDIIPERRDRIPPRAPAERHRFHVPRELDSDALVRATLLPLNDALETRSHLYVLVRNRLEMLRMKAGLTALYFPDVFRRDEAASGRWTVTADICAEIRRVAEENGARALFVLIPASYQIDASVFDRYVEGFDIDPSSVDLEQPNRIMAGLMRERGLEVIDILPALRAAHAGGTRLYGEVDPHFNAAGHALLADVVTPVAARLLEDTTARSGT